MNNRPETIKYIKVNIGRTLHDLCFKVIFKDLEPIAKEIDSNKPMGYIKLIGFCNAKDVST